MRLIENVVLNVAFCALLRKIIVYPVSAMQHAVLLYDIHHTQYLDLAFPHLAGNDLIRSNQNALSEAVKLFVCQKPRAVASSLMYQRRTIKII